MQPIVNMRLKIEINTREHLNVLGLKDIPYRINNTWFSGQCRITGYKVEELLGTKLEALYQRKKGRDLFDLYCALTNLDIDFLQNQYELVDLCAGRLIRIRNCPDHGKLAELESGYPESGGGAAI